MPSKMKPILQLYVKLLEMIGHYYSTVTVQSTIELSLEIVESMMQLDGKLYIKIIKNSQNFEPLIL